MDKNEYREHAQTFGDALRAKLKADRGGLLERLMGQGEADEPTPEPTPEEGE